MKVVVLAGGLGTRIMEETIVRPKPMVEIGGRPILWHIMQLYASQGFDDFAVALGYKGEMIKEYFLNYRMLNSDVRVELESGHAYWRAGADLKWQVELVNTGQDSQTGGRLRRMAPSLRSEGTFMVTYGDGLSDVDLNALLAFHKSHGKLATVTAVHPPNTGRRLSLPDDSDIVGGFEDRSYPPDMRVNGGFFVFEPGVLDYISRDKDILEADVLTKVTADGELMAFKHDGFWQCMDTIQERNLLEDLWLAGDAPWTRFIPSHPAPAMERKSKRFISRVQPATYVSRTS